MANYSYVVPVYYNPMSLETLMKTGEVYKQNYDQLENDYVALQDKANQFKYLSETLPEDSDARKIYEGYANELNTQADSLLNGNIMGARKALAGLKGRYSSEIGRIVKADTLLNQVKQQRMEMAQKDPSYRYAVNNLNIDDFMDGKTPNMYGVSINSLYARGINAGKAASSRQISVGDAGSTLGGYYRDYVQKMGYPNAEQFRQDMEAIPELKQAYLDIKKEMGVDNLTGIDREQAEQGIRNGIVDGIIYQEEHKPVQDIGVEAPSQKLQREQMQLQYDKLALQQKESQWKYQYDEEGNIIGYNPDWITAEQMKNQMTGNTGSKPQNVTKTKPIRLKFKQSFSHDNPYDVEFDEKNYTVEQIAGSDTERQSPSKFRDLPESLQESVRLEVDPNNEMTSEQIDALYNIYYRSYKSGWFDDDEPIIEIIPKTGNVKITPKTEQGSTTENANTPTSIQGSKTDFNSGL